MAPIQELARAKVNLFLEVLRPREDGYHGIDSVVAFADVGDRLEFEPGAPAGVRTTGSFARGIAGCNLASRALEALARAEPRLTLGAVMLEKNLPVAAGLGGGSADAAAVLRAVRAANPELAPAVPWRRIATQLGADVPVCLASRAARITGKGDTVELLSAMPRIPAVLIHAADQVLPDKTARVFRRFAETSRSRAGRAAPALPCTIEQAGELVANRGNDLLDAALSLCPVVAEVFAALRESMANVAAGLSGAGPACFGLFRDEASARHAAATIGDRKPNWWVRATILS